MKPQEIANQLCAEFARWGATKPVSPTEVATLARALARPDVEIGEIGIMCAVVGFLTAKRDGAVGK